MTKLKMRNSIAIKLNRSSILATIIGISNLSGNTLGNGFNDEMDIVFYSKVSKGSKGSNDAILDRISSNLYDIRNNDLIKDNIKYRKYL